jgi:2-amino-4-hydroxy-6-hydroxymethyldihydropteridine diphosphokinase
VQILEYAPTVERSFILHDLSFEKTESLVLSVVISLGSNLGDSKDIVRRAISRLQFLSDTPLLESSLWQTTPVDCPLGSPVFVNAVVGLEPRPRETPESLLAKLQLLEKEFGRTGKKIFNEPRRLDLDLIAFGEEIRNSPSLTLPHPRAHQRRFVLQPLSEITPDLVLPGQRQTVAELLAALRSDETLVRLT